MVRRGVGDEFAFRGSKAAGAACEEEGKWGERACARARVYAGRLCVLVRLRLHECHPGLLGLRGAGRGWRVWRRSGRSRGDGSGGHGLRRVEEEQARWTFRELEDVGESLELFGAQRAPAATTRANVGQTIDGSLSPSLERRPTRGTAAPSMAMSWSSATSTPACSQTCRRKKRDTLGVSLSLGWDARVLFLFSTRQDLVLRCRRKTSCTLVTTALEAVLVSVKPTTVRERERRCPTRERDVRDACQHLFTVTEVFLQ